MSHQTVPRRVLLTGDRGSVGRWLKPYLRHRGYDVRGFDIRDGRDILDAAAVREATAAADAIVHAATLGWLHEPQSEIFDANVLGARNVLAAAEAARHQRVVVFSSPHVFGIIDPGQRPIALPVRDDHPRSATQPYGRSKVELEDLCQQFSERTGIATLCPRPGHVWAPGQAADTRRAWTRRPEDQWEPTWHYGAFLDVRDLGEAIDRCLRLPLSGHHRFLLAAPDTASIEPPRELVGRICPAVSIDPAWPDEASLFDTTVARELLGWIPRYTWAAESKLSWPQRAFRRLARARTFGLWAP